MHRSNSMVAACLLLLLALTVAGSAAALARLGEPAPNAFLSGDEDPEVVDAAPEGPLVLFEGTVTTGDGGTARVPFVAPDADYSRVQVSLLADGEWAGQLSVRVQGPHQQEVVLLEGIGIRAQLLGGTTTVNNGVIWTTQGMDFAPGEWWISASASLGGEFPLRIVASNPS